MWFRTTHDQTNSFNNWRQIWHTGNFDPNSKAASNHNHNHDNYKYLQYTNRFHSDNSVTVDNFRCGHTFNYTTGGSPVTGPLLSFGGLASNYDCQITSNYTNGADLYTRTHNGDTGIWSAWHRIWTSGNFNPEHPGSTLSIGGNSLYIYLQDQDIWGSKWCSLDMGRNVPLGNLQSQNYYGASDRNLKNDIEYLDDKNKGAISKKEVYNYFKNSFKPSTFFYKNQTKKDTILGIIAQDIENTPIGDLLVNTHKIGTLQINLSSYITSVAIALQQSIKEVEELKTKLKIIEEKLGLL